MASDVRIYLMLAVLALCIEGVLLSDEKRLIKMLMDRYEDVGVVGRPVFNASEQISVEYGLALIQILELNSRTQVLTTNCWSRYVWTDILLTWDEEEYGGVDQVRVPTSKIWTPDIVLYNYADDRIKEHRDAYAVVSSNGGVMWIPQAIFKSSCPIDITHFPFDVQKCKLKFGSWTYDGFKLDIKFFGEDDQVDLNDYIPSNEWEVLEHPATRHVKYYPCCIEPFPDLTFFLTLQRKVAFYNYILILPCVLLSSLTLVLFWLPPESPAKMVLGMNIFVAFFVLLLLLAESTPPAASNIPLIGAYYCLNMIMITLSTFLSVIVINLYFRGDKKNRVPWWMKKLFIEYLAWLMCMRGELITDEERAEKAAKKEAALNDGVHEKSGRHRKKVKCPEMKYNKFQMYDMKESSPFANHASGGGVFGVAAGGGGGSVGGGAGGSSSGGGSGMGGAMSPDKSPVHSHQSVESDVKEIRRYLRQMLGRVHMKEERAKIALEWKVVALVMDRLFFFLYLAAIIISLATIFPKTK